jgi:hypothetical protein
VLSNGQGMPDEIRYRETIDVTRVAQMSGPDLGPPDTLVNQQQQQQQTGGAEC